MQIRYLIKVQINLMGARGRRKKRRCILGYTPWHNRIKIWFLSTFAPPKGVSNRRARAYIYIYLIVEAKIECLQKSWLLVTILVLDLLICICIICAGLSFTEADRRLRENGPNVPLGYTFPNWWHLLWHAFFHPFNIILIILSALSYVASDSPNGCIMLILVFISVSLRFYQVFSA
jgi:hypothetical protein